MSLGEKYVKRNKKKGESLKKRWKQKTEREN
jgi:hypothetical protein